MRGGEAGCKGRRGGMLPVKQGILCPVRTSVEKSSIYAERMYRILE